MILCVCETALCRDVISDDGMRSGHRAEVAGDVRGDVLLERALKAVVVRLPGGEELRWCARARDLDKRAAPRVPLLRLLVGQHGVPLRGVQRPQDHRPLFMASR
jgi:hypothetical protein